MSESKTMMEEISASTRSLTTGVDTQTVQLIVLDAVISVDMVWLAIVAVFFSIIGAFYYLRIVKIMYFDDAVEGFEPMPRTLATVLGASGLLTLFYFVYPAPLVAVAGLAAKSLF